MLNIPLLSIQYYRLTNGSDLPHFQLVMTQVSKDLFRNLCKVIF